MKRLMVLFLALPSAMQAMEVAAEQLFEKMAQRYIENEAKPSWVKLVEEVLPEYMPPVLSGNNIPPLTRFSQIIAQQILRSKPEIREFILTHLILPSRDCHSPSLEREDRYSKVSHSAAFNRRGDKVLLNSDYQTAKIVSVETGNILHALAGEGRWIPVASAEFNATGDKVVTASGKTAKIWSVETGEHLITLEGHDTDINSAVFSPTGDRIVTSSSDNTAKIWDVETGKVIYTLEGHTDSVNTAVFNSTGHRIVTGSQDATARIWDATNGTVISVLRGHNGTIVEALFSPAGDIVVTGSQDATARIWDTSSGRLLNILEGHERIRFVVFSPKGDKFVTLSDAFRIWDSANGELLQVINDNMVKSAVFDPTGDKIITTAFEGTTAKIWDTATGRLLRVLDGHKMPVVSIGFNATGNKVVTGSYDIAKIWDLEPRIRSEKFLDEDITHLQLALLLDMFAVVKARDFVAAHNKVAARKGKHSLIDPKELTFDFSNCPHLLKEYESMPDAIREIFDPYLPKFSKINVCAGVGIASTLALGVAALWYFSNDNIEDTNSSALSNGRVPGNCEIL